MISSLVNSTKEKFSGPFVSTKSEEDESVIISPITNVRIIIVGIVISKTSFILLLLFFVFIFFGHAVLMVHQRKKAILSTFPLEKIQFALSDPR